MVGPRLPVAAGRLRRGLAPGNASRDAATALAGTRIVFQPIVAVANGSLFGAEALTRFGRRVGTGPQDVFGDAHAAGFGAELELTSLHAALLRRRDLPASALVSVNLSPEGLVAATDRNALPTDLTGVIIEITEQDITSPVDVSRALAELRERGAALAVDDVGSGYAGLLRVAELHPDYVKVDRRIVAGVGDSTAQAAVLEALVTLSHRLGAAVIAEGVESLADLESLGEFDVDYAQGYAIGHPAAALAPIDPLVVAACRAGRQRKLSGSEVLRATAARLRDVYAVTAALAAADTRNDLVAAISRAAAEIGVDVLAVSIIAADGTIREIAVTGGPRDPRRYPLTQYPATVVALTEQRALEVQMADPTDDAAERSALQTLGFESLLLVPVLVDGHPAAMLEFLHRSPRRWSADDIAYGQGMAQHVGPVLQRLDVTAAH